jgi:hypothetical protein
MTTSHLAYNRYLTLCPFSCLYVGPFPDFSSSNSLASLDLSNNMISGDFNAAYMPPKVTLLNFANNSITSGTALSITALGSSAVLLDLSHNQISSSLSAKDLTFSTSRSSNPLALALRLEGNRVFCPVPSFEELSTANGVSTIVLHDECKVNISQGMPLYVIASILMLIGLGIFVKTMSRGRSSVGHYSPSSSAAASSSSKKLSKIAWFILVVRVSGSIFDFVNDIIVYDDIYRAVNVKSTDTCDLVNANSLFDSLMPFTFSSSATNGTATQYPRKYLLLVYYWKH